MSDKELEQEILEGACLTLEQLASAAALEREWLAQRIEAGLIPATGESVTTWRFSSTVIVRARRMREIERAYEAPPELAALVADMLEELDALRRRLRRFE